MSKQETIFLIGSNQWSIFLGNEYKGTESIASLKMSSILDYHFHENNINAHKIGVVIYPLGFANTDDGPK
jgi:hypothetical protein